MTNMITSKEDRGQSWLMVAKKGSWEFCQLYSKNIPLEKINNHFEIEANIRYEKLLGNNG